VADDSQEQKRKAEEESNKKRSLNEITVTKEELEKKE
jgi:hypothetical protein